MATIDERIELKTANTVYPVHDIIRSRWSPRAFSEAPIDEASLLTLFEAASWAASAFNEQPWSYIYAHRADEEGFQRLLSCLNPSNQSWAQQAAVLVLSIAKKQYVRNGKPNRHYMHDTGAANATLLIQAATQDIYGHMMAGFDYGKTVEVFKLKEETEPVCFMALGYLGEDLTHLDEGKQLAENKGRSRKPVSDFIKKL
jgi:nitroreductase